MTHKIRVIVADDHECVRAGVRHLLQERTNMEIVGEAADTHGLAELLDAHACDVVVSDVGMPGIDGGSNAVPFLRRLLRRRSHPYVVVLTMVCHGHMLSGLRNIGVTGIVDKREAAATLIDAIVTVCTGRVHLSDQVRVALDAVDPTSQFQASALSAREWEVFQLYVQGLAVHEIAQRLQRSAKTISTQKRSAMRKLGLETEADLIDYARKIGLA
ncbi:Two component transcriptional regulator, LuxR family [Paraburkholderia ribeironis]|uniref:Two component transcriptional regulator, LuxR family n=1 Tax=Paraburkholderia ribeironis TaxID=1247936 RepID=A0A1N7RLW9_9BURK|nr:response regulator transcription factor [Paraburkholderia ribeironis]SIT36096.1 Two component transcriptional regulator, LuxR family [Paraburkholderia ribeironis]